MAMKKSGLKKGQEYTADSIQVLEGLEAVRKKIYPPSTSTMYIAAQDKEAKPNQDCCAAGREIGEIPPLFKSFTYSTRESKIEFARH